MEGQRIWRYFRRDKFLSLLERQALWMSRLGILADLNDPWEGAMPEPTRRAAQARDLQMARTFPSPIYRAQIAAATNDNVSNGRDMYVANCWFEGPDESQVMWEQYAGDADGIAVQSTVARLRRSVRCAQEWTRLDRVRYVDMKTHDMGIYKGSQAVERAFLKDLRYRHESEVRLVTMNVVCPGTLNPDGSPPSGTQLSGPGAFDPERTGLFLLVDLAWLVRAVIIAPGASDLHRSEIVAACSAAGLACEVRQSALGVPSGAA